MSEALEQCAEVGELPETLQVAWVSRVGARARNGTGIVVVRTADLRQLAETRGRDETAVLQALGLVRGKKARGDWKVVVFDVQRDWLCRPADADAGLELSGVPVCGDAWQGSGPGVKDRSYSGCGYLLDTRTEQKTLDVYRISWEDAVSWGFCVLPLERFLKGA